MSIRRRGKNSWEITISHGFDPVTGERIRTFHSFKGTKRQAEENRLGCYIGGTPGSASNPRN